MSIAGAAYRALIPASPPTGCRPRLARQYDPRVHASDPLEASRAALVAARARLLAELADAEVLAPGQITYGSQAAAATHVFEQQRDLALRDHDRQLLAAVEEALARVEAGTHGTCTSCGNPIGAERLEALPSAALCIECQRTARR